MTLKMMKMKRTKIWTILKALENCLVMKFFLVLAPRRLPPRVPLHRQLPQLLPPQVPLRVLPRHRLQPCPRRRQQQLLPQHHLQPRRSLNLGKMTRMIMILTMKTRRTMTTLWKDLERMSSITKCRQLRVRHRLRRQHQPRAPQRQLQRLRQQRPPLLPLQPFRQRDRAGPRNQLMLSNLQLVESQLLQTQLMCLLKNQMWSKRISVVRRGFLQLLSRRLRRELIQILRVMKSRSWVERLTEWVDHHSICSPQS